ncbi:MAG: SH3 domain-containing protein [Aggregatilineaceae bacterium]
MGATHPLKGLVPVWLALFLAALACTLTTSPVDESTARLERAPLVLVLAPVNGSTYAEGTRVALYAIAQDIGGGVARIEFRVDDIPVATVSAENTTGVTSLLARAEWIASERRRHLLTVEAFRADGSSLGVSDISLQVIQPPAETQSTTIPTPLAPTASPQTGSAGESLLGPVARINVNDLNVRAGPGTAYPVLGTLSLGTQVQIIGRTADSTWLATSFNGTTGWILAELTAVEGDLNAVPVLAAP